MKILVDENIPRTTVEWLRSSGHDVQDVRGTPVQGVSDPELWASAIKSGRMLITTDRGFTAQRKTDHQGILIVRLRQPNRARIHAAVQTVMSRFSPDGWPGRLVVIRDQTISVSLAGGTVEKG